jgi:hypothetical protein
VGSQYPACDPLDASQLFRVTIETANTLYDYPISVRLDSAQFDFSQAQPNGGDIWFWEPQAKAPLNHWVERYDVDLGKALIWVRIPTLLPGYNTIWLVQEEVSGCPMPASDGYAVFPFFSDVADVENWQDSATTTVTNTRMSGAITVEERRVIVSDGMYNAFPSVVEAANGEWVLGYRKTTGHVVPGAGVLRRSRDQGATWSEEVAYFDVLPLLARTPNGDLLNIRFKSDKDGGTEGVPASRSTDNGLSWSPFLFLDEPISISGTGAFPTALVTVDSSLYGANYGPSPYRDDGNSSTLWTSDDDGLTWRKLSEIRQSALEPGFNETAIAFLADLSFLAVMRSDGGNATYARVSTDMGLTWGSLRDITAQVGVLQLPQLTWLGDVLLLTGRQAIGIANKHTSASYTRQVVAYLSWDGGKTWREGSVVQSYSGSFIDGGYTWTLPLDQERVFLVYYADTYNQRRPDIKSAILSVGESEEEPVNGLHVVSGIPDHPATRSVDINLVQYAIEARFRSWPASGGSQFALVALDSIRDRELVRWELPSTNATNPENEGGVIADSSLITVTNSWAYSTTYRIRSLVDEIHGRQQAELLDLWGEVIAMRTNLALAERQGGHVNALAVGSGTPYRATDTLLDWLFIRPMAPVEPVVRVFVAPADSVEPSFP